MGTITSEHLALEDDYNAQGRIKVYEELEGGQGREIFFRPHRYTADHFAPLRIWVELNSGHSFYRCEIQDLSQSGVGLIWPDAHPPQLGDKIEHFHVRFDHQSAYEGEALVSVVRTIEEGVLVGLDLQDHLIKIDSLLQTRDLKNYHLKGKAPFGGRESAWHVAGQSGVKAQIGELRLYLEDWEAHFKEIEKKTSWDLLRLDDEHPTRRALTELVKSDFMPNFLEQTEILFERTVSLSEDVQKPLQAFSQRYLDAYFMSAPWMHRARTKPLGYPGDYEVMNHIYRNQMEGRSLLGQAINYSTLNSPAAQAVRNRKDMLKAQLTLLCQSTRKPGERIRILSVAAGPAQEIYELLSEINLLSAPVDLVLFDQDPAALAYAYGRLKELVDQRWPNDVRLVYLHDSIRRLLNDMDLFNGFGQFDAVICSGLYDYLKHSTAVKLTEHMYSYLKVGGQVFIGNMVPSNRSRWIMEHHLEWNLLYRSHDEILSFSTEACPTADHRIITEPSGVNPFVGITRLQ